MWLTELHGEVFCVNSPLDNLCASGLAGHKVLEVFLWSFASICINWNATTVHNYWLLNKAVFLFLILSVQKRLKMMKFVQILLCYGLLLTLFFALSEARPSGAETGPVSNILGERVTNVAYSFDLRTPMDLMARTRRTCEAPMEVATICQPRQSIPIFQWIGCRCSLPNTDPRKAKTLLKPLWIMTNCD